MATCYTNNDIERLNGKIIENQDGSVSVYIPNNLGKLSPVIISKPCCLTLNPNYVFDLDKQTCLWSTNTTACGIEDVFKIVLNPSGNDGSIFYKSEKQNCSLNVSFDYLFKVKCESLNELLNENSSSISNEILTQISNLENQISEQTPLCEELTNQISVLIQQISNSSYSIVCETLEYGKSTVVTLPSSSEKSLSKTGFGDFNSVSPTITNSSRSIESSSEVPNVPESGVHYCLTEPAGLFAWGEIIGQTNYQSFLNGVKETYSCTDVYALFALNEIRLQQNGEPLIFECERQVVDKGELTAQLYVLLAQQQECQAILNDLNSQLLVLISSPEYQEYLRCNRPINFFERLDVSMTVDVITSANTLETIYEATDFFPAIGNGSLYNYLTTNIDSGFYVCGGVNCTPLILDKRNVYDCILVLNSLLDDLFVESELTGTTNGNTAFLDSISPSAFTSNWLQYSTTISDSNIIDLISNQKIKISLKLNNTCSDVCILLDNIELNKICVSEDKNEIFVTQSPSFKLDRIRDNKKSWLNNTSKVNRDFNLGDYSGLNQIRQTNYDLNDERLIINTKEIDLDINLASAIETDIWCYLLDNPCLLTGNTFCDPCLECGYKNFQDDYCFEFMNDDPYEFMDGTYSDSPTTLGCCGDNQIDFNALLTQPLSAVTVVEDFEYFLQSELIDVKNRQTISSYPTLRALYDRYLNSNIYCGTNSSAFDYMSMDQFAGLLGNYWVDIIEQVVPSTTIWGSVKIYSNTIFDNQKYRYKSYSSLFCENPFTCTNVLSPINGNNGQYENVEVSLTNIETFSDEKIKRALTDPIICDSIHIAQMNHGSEFIGTVSILGSVEEDCDSNQISINECSLQVTVSIDGVTVIPRVVGATTPVTYLWSNGETTPTASFPSGGTHSLTVTDEYCSATVEFFVNHLTACWYTLPDMNFWITEGFSTYGVTAFTYIMESMVVNETELVLLGSEPTYNLIESNFDPLTLEDGETYINFVTFLNQAFVTLGLNEYSAQISINNFERPDGLNEKYNGFYIVRPIVDTFSMYIREDENFDTIYTNDSASEASGFEYIKYRAAACNNIVVENGVVIE